MVVVICQRSKAKTLLDTPLRGELFRLSLKYYDRISRQKKKKIYFLVRIVKK